MVVVCQFHYLSAIDSLIESLWEALITLVVVLGILSLDLIIDEPSALAAAVDCRNNATVAIFGALKILTLLNREDDCAL